MHLPPEFCCPAHGTALVLDGAERLKDASVLTCPRGCHFPVVGGIPRFTSATNYASAFGLQWKTFQKTQLDSYTGLTISQDRLARCLGGSLDHVRGKSVLEVGCGAGRFTELLLAAGARVFACDLSVAVEANYDNCKQWPEYFVCQADLQQLPAAPRSFDIVLCLGVIQHTPDPEATITKLAEYIKPGGMLVIDHYTHNYPASLSRRLLRLLLLRLPPALAQRAVFALAHALLPMHRALWSKRIGSERLRSYWLRISPLVDYHDSYPQLSEKLLEEWAILDTHDTLTDQYKHFRSIEQIRRALAVAGLTEIEADYGGNGVEARATRPTASDPSLVNASGGT